MTETQRAALEQRRSLELTRARVSNDLSRASQPHHKRMLEQALADIDEQLSRLS